MRILRRSVTQYRVARAIFRGALYQNRLLAQVEKAISKKNLYVRYKLLRAKSRKEHYNFIEVLGKMLILPRSVLGIYLFC